MHSSPNSRQGFSIYFVVGSLHGDFRGGWERATPKLFAPVGLCPRADARATMATDEPACHVLSILVRQQQGGYGPVRLVMIHNVSLASVW